MERGLRFKYATWWSIEINFPQFNWRPIHETPNIIYGWNFVLPHKPIEQIKKYLRNAYLYALPKFQGHPLNNLNPSFKIYNLLNQLWNEISLLQDHENFHQICQNVVVLLFQLFWRISKTSINILMCMTNYKESQFNLLKYFPHDQ